MPNKSDSAGKLHQYFTAVEIQVIYPDCLKFSPLDKSSERNIHLSQFTSDEIKSLKKIGHLTAKFICSFVKDKIEKVEDIGVSSGAIGNTVTDDLIVETGNKVSFSFSLKCSKNIKQILSKNMGAKSLLEQYFNSPNEQIAFNIKMEEEYLEFLNCTLNTNYIDITTAKSAINKDAEEDGNDKPRFADAKYSHMNKKRDVFLKNIRDELISQINTINNSKQAQACNLILDVNKHHILAEYKKGKEKIEYVFIPEKTKKDISKITKRGNDSAVIITNDYEVGFRFKFESGITSSIKLVGDYKRI